MNSPPVWKPSAEVGTACRLAAVVLLTLLVVKPLGSIPWLGPLAFTLAAGLQLYLPIWRMDYYHFQYDFLGLHFTHWRDDLRWVLVLCAITFPPFVLGHHFFMTEARALAAQFGFVEIIHLLPNHRFSPSIPSDITDWLDSIQWFTVMAATHLLGVALPEETFYRGYLQPRLEVLWPPKRRFFGALMGKAVFVTALLFALGHFLGEWNPLRLGPFFPALIFAWQRNKTGSIWGAILFHGACNILGEVLFSLYAPN